VNRRAFLAKLGAVVAATVAAPHLPAAPAPPSPVYGLFNPRIDIARQYREGILSRDPRLDVLYGAGSFRAPMSCRIEA
jgi:hypothetical protein